VDNGLASVTVVCRSSAMADALSTACFVLGEEKGMALIQSQDNVEALFIRTDGTMTATDGLLYEKQ
jgi:thiamine biosynthesis lipoprotein